MTQLRAGALPRVEIETVIGDKVHLANTDAPVQAPGMSASHYAPRTPLRLGATEPRPGEAFLAFGPTPVDGPGPVRNLSPSADLREAARNLFGMLHELDAMGVEKIAVASVPTLGLGEAINDRLSRAAAPR